MFDLGDGQCDRAHVRWWLLVRCVGKDGRWRAGFGVSGGDRADGQRGRCQIDMPEQGGVGAGLGVIQPEMVLPNSTSSWTGQRRQATRTGVVKAIGSVGGM
ncbi:hypothetical protein [Fodinicola acaciae]|uniref:hypothetical protein n=1 Tax=Fodinicola acaciae TaxID=2681555 RepID=UPI0013D8CBE6|nr:hypothetical protein [Fodinicola acaciae]